MTVTDTRLLQVIESIYSSPGDLSAWAACLESIRALFDGTAAHLHHHDHRSHDGGISVEAGLDPEATRLYSAHYHKVDPWAGSVNLAQVSVGAALDGEALVPADTMRRTEFFSDLGRPYGLARGLFGYLEAPTPFRSSVLCVNRSHTADAFSVEHTRLMAMIVPHLQRALMLQRRLSGVWAERTAMADILDRLQTGAILIDGERRVVFMNRSAEELLRHEDGLTVEDGELRAATSTTTRVFKQALGVAVSASSGPIGPMCESVMTLPRPSGKRDLQVLVVPLSHEIEPLGGRRPAAALFVADPESIKLPSGAIVAKLFGLTPAETRFALAMTAGQTPPEAAEALGITKPTGRWLTEQVRLKTGSRTQAQAVITILRSLAPFGRDPG